MPRMPARVSPPWCPHCNASPGPDCPDVGLKPRQVRRRLRDALKRAPEDQ